MSIETHQPVPGSASATTARGGRRWIIAGSLLAMAVFGLAVTFLCLQWMRNSDPNAILVVQISAPLEGAEVTIAPLDNAGRAPFKAKVGGGDEPQVVFHVPSGAYRMTVRDARGDLLFPRNPAMGDISAKARKENKVVVPAGLLMLPVADPGVGRP